MKMRCPHCHVRGTVEDMTPGRVMRCPRCLQLFRIPAESNELSVQGDSEASSSRDDASLVGAELSPAFAPGTEAEDEPSTSDTSLAEGESTCPGSPRPDSDEREVGVAAEDIHHDPSLQEASSTGEADFPDLSARSVTCEAVAETRQEHPVVRLENDGLKKAAAETSGTLVSEGEIAGDLDALLAESCTVCGKPLPDGATAVESVEEIGDRCEACRVGPLSGVPTGDEPLEERGSQPRTEELPGAGSGLPVDQEQRFTVSHVLKDSWTAVKGSKAVIWFGVVVLGLVLAGVEAVHVSLLPRAAALGGVAATSWVTIVSHLLGSLLILLFIAGLMIVGVRHVSGCEYSWRTVFCGFALPGRIAVAGFLLVLLISSGFVLLILPGIYLSVGYSLTLPLMIDKGYGPWQAMEASRQLIHPQWWRVFALFVVVYFIYLLSCIPLGIGLIWTVPLFFVLTGVLYQHLVATNGCSGSHW